MSQLLTAAPSVAAVPDVRAGARVRGALLIAGLAGAALLFRPYMGFFGDARIYLGRALADLDPQGVGRDLMFAHDGQSGFSVFPAALAKLVGATDLASASVVAALAALALWTAAAGALLRALLGAGRWVAPMLAVLVLPSAYGGYALSIGEAAAVPRPFAEAFVLLGLAALLAGRTGAAVALMAAAATLHPIMALPGFGALLLVLGLEDRRWLLAVPVGAAVAAAAVALRLPLADRLLRPVDPAWREVLTRSSPYVFLRLWPASAWARVAVQAATAALAAGLLEGRARRLWVAVLAVAAAALAVSLGLGDGAGSLLVVQMQPWRGLWLLSFTASASVPMVAVALWRRSPTARLAVGAMFAAWAGVVLAAAAAVCAAAMLTLAWIDRRGATLPRAALAAGWAGLIALAALLLLYQTEEVIGAFTVRPSARAPLHFYAVLDLYRVVAEAALLGVGAWLGTARSGRAAAAVALAALAEGALTWNSFAPGAEPLASREAARRWRTLVASRPGAVEWIGGDLQPAVFAGRPAWHSELQGASSVFSRDQAMEWSRRTRRLVDGGMGPPSLLRRFPHERPAPLWRPSPAAVAAFCRASDAPAWVVAPVAPGDAAPPGAEMWRAPRAEPFALRSGGPLVLVDRYALLPCADAHG